MSAGRRTLKGSHWIVGVVECKRIRWQRWQDNEHPQQLWGVSMLSLSWQRAPVAADDSCCGDIWHPTERYALRVLLTATMTVWASHISAQNRRFWLIVLSFSFDTLRFARINRWPATNICSTQQPATVRFTHTSAQQTRRTCMYYQKRHFWHSPELLFRVISSGASEELHNHHTLMLTLTLTLSRVTSSAHFCSKTVNVTTSFTNL